MPVRNEFISYSYENKSVLTLDNLWNIFKILESAKDIGEIVFIFIL